MKSILLLLRSRRDSRQRLTSVKINSSEEIFLFLLGSTPICRVWFIISTVSAQTTSNLSHDFVIKCNEMLNLCNWRSQISVYSYISFHFYGKRRVVSHIYTRNCDLIEFTRFYKLRSKEKIINRWIVKCNTGNDSGNRYWGHIELNQQAFTDCVFYS